jgi:hypothetical protein
VLSFTNGRCWFDFLSFLVGIYIDSDVLILRDLTPLCNATFVYQWSDKDADNSAVFGCAKNCRFVNEFIGVGCDDGQKGF